MGIWRSAHETGRVDMWCGGFWAQFPHPAHRTGHKVLWCLRQLYESQLAVKEQAVRLTM